MRDLTEKQFKAALERYGLEFCEVPLWVRRKGDSTISIGLIVNSQTYRPMYRKSLARILHSLEKYDQEKVQQGERQCQ